MDHGYEQASPMLGICGQCCLRGGHASQCSIGLRLHALHPMISHLGRRSFYTSEACRVYASHAIAPHAIRSLLQCILRFKCCESKGVAIRTAKAKCRGMSWRLSLLSAPLLSSLVRSASYHRFLPRSMLSLPSPAASPSRLHRSSSSSSSLSSMLSPPRWASRRRLSVSSLFSVSSLASSASSVSISISVSPDDDGGAQLRCLEVVHEEGSEREREQQQQHVHGIPRASSSSSSCIAAEAASSKSARGRQHQHHRRSISSSLSFLRLVRREDDVDEEENRSRNRNCRRMSSPPTPLRSAMRSPVHSPSPTTTTASSSLAGTGSAPGGPAATTPTSTSRPHTATSIASSSATGFVPRVSFDATQAAQLGSTGGGTGIEQSFTIRATTAGFVRTRESRTFLVATDLNEYSLHAMHWALDKLIEGEAGWLLPLCTAVS